MKSIERFKYGKWDSAEDAEIAFYNVKNGIWDLVRFEAWVQRVQLDEFRKNSNEDM